MENQHFLDEDHIKTQPERPTFLTVLCIITFVVSGYFLLSSIYATMTYDEEIQRANIEVAVEKSEKAYAGIDSPMIQSIGEVTRTMGEESIANYGLLTTLSFLSLLLSLLGAFFMFKMQKMGFHFYAISKIIMLIPLFILTQTWLTIAIYSFIGFFGLAFVIMYATNLKHMNKA